MENIIISVVIIAIVGLAALYIYRAKKKGQKCIGCPDSGSCVHAKSGNCSCGCSADNE